jgi:DNA-directed RNA polymerase specialized sigma24 family protein
MVGDPGTITVTTNPPAPTPGRHPRRRRPDRALLESGAAAAERMLALAEWLPPTDRALIVAMYKDGLSGVAIARLRGEPVEVVRRRLARVIKRMNTPVFALVAVQSSAWPRARAEAARLCVLEGLSIRAAAERAGITAHQVRREIITVRAMAEALATAGRLAGSGAPANALRRVG